ncbi:MAG TPA: hypothetical protein VGQ55_01740 [Pyrinomonadaceae bacterium]|jgi:hypothetical protein|nr:hypothetical protein [Pyrinomonadaceae bacterium]
MKRVVTRSISLACFLSALVFGQAFGQEVNPEEVLSKHRESIGSKDKIAAIKNQMVLTDAKFTFKGGALVIAGKALILSSPEKNLFGMNFNSNDYPQDRFGFDGKDVRIGRPTPTSRSLLGEFLYNNRELLKEGLLGGVLSSSWPLLNTDRRPAKISYEGRKTIDGKSAIILSYEPKGGSDVKIKIYFDDKTFQHVRTEYTLVRAAIQGPSINTSAGQSGAIFRVVEDFSDFTKVSGLSLPKTYRITYARTGTSSLATSQTTNRDAEWTFTVTNVSFNQELDANAFNIDG